MSAILRIASFGKGSLLIVILLTCVSGCKQTPAMSPLPLSDNAKNYRQQLLARFDSQQLLADLQRLASPEMEGRKPLTAGSQKAQRYIIQRFEQADVKPLFDTFLQPIRRANSTIGNNLVAMLPATKATAKTVVISAHYDHLGKDYQGIYFGADDNASGVAALLSLADGLSGVALPFNIVLLATDAEETGLHGSKAFVEYVLNHAEMNVVLNINMDMIAQGGKQRRLYYSSSRGNTKLDAIYQQLFPLADLKLIKGHNHKAFRLTARNERIDWLNASDHAPFRRVGIPFIYFGVDPHRHYHTHTDTYQSIPPTFYIAAVKAIVTTVAIVLSDT